MDFGIIYQLKTQKFWWLDTILYSVSALLLATIICFFIFSAKISLEQTNLAALEEKIAGTGTAEQKEMEEKVFEYQKKIDSFAMLLAAHKIPTNIFKILERDTLPNVWMQSFQTSTEQLGLSLSGEAENLNVLSRQVDVFERNEFIKSINSLSSNPGEAGRISFNFSFTLDPKIFSAETILDIPVMETASPSTSLLLKPGIF